jgi:hypothetical protein
MEAMSPATPLLLNLSNSSYCQTVYGGIEPEKIAMVFSRVDPEVPVKLMEGWRQDKLSTTIPRQLERMDDLPQQLAAYISMAAKESHK